MAIALKREAFSTCMARIGAIAGVDKDTAFSIIQEVANAGERYRKAGVDNPFQVAAEEAAIREQRGAIIARTDALRNALKRTDLKAEVRANGFENVVTTVKSWMHFNPFAKNNQSIEGHWHFLEKNWMAAIGTELKNAGVLKQAISGKLDAEISEAWWRLNGGTPSTTVTISPDSQKIAETLYKATELARQRLNAAGAHIGQALDYVTHTTWDSRALRLAAGRGKSMDEAFEAWYQKSLPRIAEETFDHLTPAEGQTVTDVRKQFLRSVYNAFVTGVHLRNPITEGLMDDGTGFIPPTYEGTYNVARAKSKPRVIKWKDASSWNDHMKEFGGQQSLYAQTMLSSIRSAARGVALMEKLGTNPEGNFNQIIKELDAEFRDSHPDTVTKLKQVTGDETAGLSQNLSTTLKYLTGSANMSGGSAWADWYHHVSNWVASTKLGGVSIPHLASSPLTVTSEMAQHGVGRLQTLGNMVKALTSVGNSAERSERLSEAGALAIGFNRQLASQWQRDGGIPGAISYMANNLVEMTGISKIVQRLHADGVTAVHMNYFGRNADKEFTALDPQRQTIMKKYGISPEDWDIMRKSPNDLVADGERWITPHTVDNADAASIEALLRRRGVIGESYTPEMVTRAVQKYKWELSDKYGMYINDSAERSTVTPGVREQALFLRGAKPGSLGWMAGRSVAQFKMWPLAAWNQIATRDVAWASSKAGVASAMGMLFALSTFGGALRLTINDAIAGRPQRNFTNPGELMTAFGMGGGVGLYGDILFGEVTRSTTDSAWNMLGPIPGDMAGIMNAWSTFKRDMADEDPAHKGNAMKHAWPILARGAVNAVPFSNLFYLKGAVDYLAAYHMYEAASPGWWERTNRRLEKEGNSTMLGYKPGQGIPWGVPYVNFGRGQ